MVAVWVWQEDRGEKGVARIKGVQERGVVEEGREGCGRRAGHRRLRIGYLIPWVGGDGDQASQLFALFDGEAVINVEHSLFPVCVTGFRC